MVDNGVDDLFDEVLALEGGSYVTGKREGQEVARKRAYEEGCATGKENGYDVGLEVGRIAGFCACWLRLLDRNGGTASPDEEKLRRILLSILSSCSSVRWEAHEQLRRDVEKLRGHFRRLLATLGVAEHLTEPAVTDLSF
mmetsp:Transcript_2383/g.6647  ORF Transcript_2383/g.6647 Transcript_2383/m.6647 type:complete len:140 (+) Transcript_2383:48-467(+)